MNGRWVGENGAGGHEDGRLELELELTRLSQIATSFGSHLNRT
jgi:hypothetical protein